MQICRSLNKPRALLFAGGDGMGKSQARPVKVITPVFFRPVSAIIFLTYGMLINRPVNGYRYIPPDTSKRWAVIQPD